MMRLGGAISVSVWCYGARVVTQCSGGFPLWARLPSHTNVPGVYKIELPQSISNHLTPTMPSSSSKHTRSSSEASIPSKSSKRSSGHRRRLSSSSGTSGSPPKSVVIILPAQRQPPVVVKTPSHRTAVPPPPALISRSASATAALPTTRSRPILIPQQRIPHHGSVGSDPNISRHRISGSPSSPSNLATQTTNYMYTITPVSRSASSSSSSPPSHTWSSRATAASTVGTIDEEEYYNHPAVRAYEVQKAMEQAAWNRRAMHERESQMRNMGISGSLDSAGGWMHQHAVSSGPSSYQHQRW
ncbi:hypothetical protein BKA70DRAFT_750618 [Coprinopsis sp. MPI-PUGE-AT-0042]|nr:hypothetical protein BKA70DRAFT_750618 [Coprinopsis sp. MPI-PUGE-AT-0042]